MIKPTKYKSISTVDLKARQIVPITNVQKAKVVSILQKLSDFIKLKHT